MTEVDRKLAASLSADSTELIPYLPYLLQDLWEMGSNPADVIDIIKKNVPHYRDLKALDLACGKGAVAIKLAKSAGIKVTGMDIVPEFIDYAVKKANEYELNHMLEFKVNDINKAVNSETGYGIVILGSADGLLGGRSESLKKIAKTIVTGGYAILCDSISYDGDVAPTKKQWLEAFSDSGYKLIGEKFTDESYIISNNSFNQDNIVERARELKEKYPDKEDLFNDYVEAQQAECELMESDLTGVTFLLQKI
jgi:SAM-dependent methyltransferase